MTESSCENGCSCCQSEAKRGNFRPTQVLYDLPELLDRNRRTAERFAERIREEGQPQVDNPWQQAGEFVIGGDGVLQLTYRYQYCEDYPDPRVLTTTIRAATK
ncbi:MAG: hypothetical protein R3324_15545 [Halobacteriales archaeon]|nr:hypothetical protein [Halobacteriales archaeon]